MKNIFKEKNNFTNKTYWIKFLPIFSIFLGEVLIYSIPLVMWMIVPDLPQRLNLSQGQYLNLLSVYGFSILIFLIPGGWLTDNYRIKPQIISGMLLTSLLFLIWIFLPFWGGGGLNEQGKNDNVYYLLSFFAVYILWGLADSLLFGPQMLKIISIESDKSESKNSIFALEEFFNGLIGFFVVYLVGLLLLLIGISISGINLGFFIYGIFLSICSFSVVFLMWKFLEEKQKCKKKKKRSFKFGDIFKDYRIWLASLMVMGGNIVADAMVAINPYLEHNLFISIWILSLLGVMSAYIIKVFCGLGFYNYQKSYSALSFYLIIFAFAIVCLISIITLPGFGDFTDKNESYQFFVKNSIIFFVLIISIFISLMLMNEYLVIKDLGIKEENYGVVLSLSTIIIYSPGAWLYFILGKIANNNLLEDGSGYSTKWGNQLSLIIVTGLAFICFLCGFIFWYLNHKKIKSLANVNYFEKTSN